MTLTTSATNSRIATVTKLDTLTLTTSATNSHSATVTAAETATATVLPSKTQSATVTKPDTLTLTTSATKSSGWTQTSTVVATRSISSSASHPLSLSTTPTHLPGRVPAGIRVLPPPGVEQVRFSKAGVPIFTLQPLPNVSFGAAGVLDDGTDVPTSFLVEQQPFVMKFTFAGPIPRAAEEHSCADGFPCSRLLSFAAGVPFTVTLSLTYLVTHEVRVAQFVASFGSSQSSVAALGISSLPATLCTSTTVSVIVRALDALGLPTTRADGMAATVFATLDPAANATLVNRTAIVRGTEATCQVQFAADVALAYPVTVYFAAFAANGIVAHAWSTRNAVALRHF